MQYRFFSLFFLFIFFVCRAEEDAKKESPPKIGNFALKTSQQPAVLFGFGGNVIEKNDIQLYFFADSFRGNAKKTTDLIPSLLLGVTDSFSIAFNFPFTPQFKDGLYSSKGLEDFSIQLEYAIYTHSSSTAIDQITVLATPSFPTGSIKKTPPTGFGGTSIFLGATYYHDTVDWFLFTAQGGLFTTEKYKSRVGNQWLYQFGFGKNIPSPKGWIYAWITELDGQYSQKNKIYGKKDKNTGGNVFYFTPSLWISNEKFLCQLGISVPLCQKVFGRQNKFNYAVNLNLAYSLH